MPTLTLGAQRHEVSEDTRLAQAIAELGIAIGHRCGGKGRCTTCRVQFSAGEPETFTKAEFDKLGLDDPDAQPPAYRLSCQILCTHDMVVTPLMTLQNQSWSDTGPALSAQVEPEAQWFRATELQPEPS